MSQTSAPSTRGKGFAASLSDSVNRAMVQQTDHIGPSVIGQSLPAEGLDLYAKAAELLQAKNGMTKAKAPANFAELKQSEISTEETPAPSEAAPADEATDETAEVTPVEIPETPPEGDGAETQSVVVADDSVRLSSEHLTKILESVETRDAAIQSLRDDLAATQVALQQSQETNRSNQATVDQSAAASALAERLTQLTGVPLNQLSAPQNPTGPHINLLTNPVAKGPSGRYGEFVQALDSGTSIVRQGARTSVIRNTVEADAIAAQSQLEVMAGLEQDMRDQGFLKGGATTTQVLQPGQGAIAQASTSIADVAGSYLPRLSSLQRLVNTYQYVFHQFVYHEYAYGRGAGTQIRFPRRASMIPKSTTANDRLLSGGNTFVPISSNTVPVQTGFKSIELMEWGLGRATVGDPVGITLFTEMYSLQSLMQVLNDSLLDDYLHWQDQLIRSIFDRTSRVAWNKGGTLTDVPANVLAGDNGTLTVDFITAAAMYLETLGVPTINGYYVLVAPTTLIRGFEADVDGKLELANESQRQTVRDIIQTRAGSAVQGINSQVVSGFVGIVSNVMIFRSNAYGTGAPGSEGTQSETLGAGTFVTRSAYIFGDGAVAHGTGMPYEIRSDMSPFMRQERLIWTSHEAYDSLDVDSLNATATIQQSSLAEETRVVELRLTEATV